MDNLNEVITGTQNKIIAALNESKLHPQILLMMMQNIIYQIELQMPKQEGGIKE